MYMEYNIYIYIYIIYIYVTLAQTRNVEYLEEIWEKAVELAMTRCTGIYADIRSRALHTYAACQLLRYFST